ncbi:hypothetical protein H0H81_000362 [Sphagnurus paluster]|uniref:Mitochondrial outer membrane protein IML2 n=1 Tax=Sphagnurus paluster TaxID=117069 RepID=A0A9P7KK14_9AGAR|nr:hypothetical protein H0H81_000362 [Sphagnurus paluster]
MSTPAQDPSSAEQLVSATRGFDHLFSNNLAQAKEHFAGNDDPFHLLGQGVCAFMEAALGMESGLMPEATRLLSLSEAGARRQSKVAPSRNQRAVSRFPTGIEWEILNADAVVLLGLTNALRLYKTVFPAGLDAYDTPSPSRAPSRKSSQQSLPSSIVSSPAPVTSIATPAAPSRSFFSRFTGGSASAAASTLSIPGTNIHVHADGPSEEDGPVEDLIIAGTAFGFGLFNLVFSLLPKKVQSLVGFLGFKHDRKLALRALAVAADRKDVHSVFAGLVLMTYHGVVLLLAGYQADEERIFAQYRAIVTNIESRYPDGALWVLNRVRFCFSVSLSDAVSLMKQTQAKILRMSYDPEGAIHVLREGLRPDRTHSFAQADTLLVFELAWTLLGQRRYQEAADMFLRVTELNSWSHGTYYFMAAGCYISLGNTEKAQELLDAVPDLIDKKKINGKDLPTEVFIKKKLAFHQEKQRRRGGDPKLWAETIKISIAEELGLCKASPYLLKQLLTYEKITVWNTHARIDKRLAIAHIREWSALTPVLPPSAAIPAPDATPTPHSPLPNLRTPRAVFGFSHALQPMPARPPSSASHHSSSSHHSASLTPRKSSSIDSLNGLSITPTPAAADPNAPLDLDTPDELAIRHLLVGICERTAGAFDAARASLKLACALQPEIRVSTWVGGVAMFELAVLDLKEVAAKDEHDRIGGGRGSVHGAVKRLTEWDRVTKAALKKLDAALALAGSAVDLSSRLDSRVSILRDEIATKREMLGI